MNQQPNGSRHVSAIWAEVAAQGQTEKTCVLSAQQRRWLAVIANRIIPVSGDMPSAGELGAPAYIEVVLRQVPELHKQVLDGLDQLNRSSRTTYQTELGLLTCQQQIDLLEAFEAKTASPAAEPGLAGARDESNLFATLRDLVYEAYYTHPDTWDRLGYTFYTTENGPAMELFDATILDRVRNRPKHYRDIR